MKRSSDPYGPRGQLGCSSPDEAHACSAGHASVVGRGPLCAPSSGSWGVDFAGGRRNDGGRGRSGRGRFAVRRDDCEHEGDHGARGSDDRTTVDHRITANHRGAHDDDGYGTSDHQGHGTPDHESHRSPDDSRPDDPAVQSSCDRGAERLLHQLHGRSGRRCSTGPTRGSRLRPTPGPRRRRRGLRVADCSSRGRVVPTGPVPSTRPTYPESTTLVRLAAVAGRPDAQGPAPGLGLTTPDRARRPAGPG